MEGFRIVLVIAGGLAILAVLIHGLRTMKRQQSPKLREKPLSNVYQEMPERDRDGFDQDGVGEVTVIKRGGDTAEKLEPIIDDAVGLSASLDEPVISTENVGSLQAEPDERPMEPAPQAAEPVAKPRAKSRAKAKPAASKPVAAKPAPEAAVAAQSTAQEPAPAPAPAQEVLVLNIVARQDEVFYGPKLDQALSLAGFRFGEMSIYHCHADANGQGPALFSVINMVQPGTFDPQNLRDFTTQGISVFMVMPGAGEPAPTFELMFDSVQTLASHLGGEIYDDQRELLSADTLHAYRQRIAQFEHNQLQQAS